MHEVLLGQFFKWRVLLCLGRVSSIGFRFVINRGKFRISEVVFIVRHRYFNPGGVLLPRCFGESSLRTDLQGIDYLRSRNSSVTLCRREVQQPRVVHRDGNQVLIRMLTP